MRGSVLLASLLLLWVGTAMAEDQGFRYQDGRCVNAEGNQGRNQNFVGQCADLSWARMPDFDFSGLDLSGSTFFHANLEKANFRASTCRDCEFASAKLIGADFAKSNLHHVDFRQADMRKAHLTEANIRSCDFSKSEMQESTLSYWAPIDSKFAAADFTGAQLDYAELANSDVRGAIFSNANMTAVNLHGAQMDAAQFTSANLTAADLSASHGGQVDFQKAKLNKANLQNVDWKGAHLEGASLVEAHLDGGDFSESNWRFSDLSRATITDAIFSKSLYNHTTILPFSRQQAKAHGMQPASLPFALVLASESPKNVQDFVDSFADKIEIMPSRQALGDFDGSEIEDARVILLIDSLENRADMGSRGQAAILNFVRDGGRLVYGAPTDYQFAQGRLQGLDELILADYHEIQQATFLLLAKGYEQNPLLKDVAEFFPSTKLGFAGGSVREKQKNSTAAWAIEAFERVPALLSRPVGHGLVLDLKVSCLAIDLYCSNDINIYRILRNVLTE